MPHPKKPAEPTPFPTTRPAEGQQKVETEDDKDKPAEQLSDEELRLMADTMPGEGPGDD